MKKAVTRRVCDQCGHTTDASEIMFGGSMFQGWFTLDRTDGSTRIPREDNGPWDLCSVKCLVEFTTTKIQGSHDS